MPVGFRISRVTIENFRGLPTLDIAIEAGAPVFLIGANNSGKSTVLNAIALAFRAAGFGRFTPEKFDFFHDAKDKAAPRFDIRIYFEASEGGQLPAVQGVGDPILVHGVHAIGRTDKSGHLDSRSVLLTINAKNKEEDVLYSTRTMLKKDKKEEFEGQDVGWRNQYGRVHDLGDHAPEIWHLRPDNQHVSLYEWRTGPLQRLARLLTKRFLESKWDFTYQGKVQPMPDTMTKVHGFFRQSVEAFPFWNEDLKPKLEESLTKYLGREARMLLRPGIQAIEEWLAQQLGAAFASDAGGAVTPLECMGDGWQSVVRVAALDVLRQYPEEAKERVILLFEEPETYLHPHLRRKLRGVLQDLAQLGWLVVCSTHAPEFISFQKPQQIVRLARSGDSVLPAVLLTKNTSQQAKWQEKLDEQGNHEMFFANKIVLCEGKDDYSALRVYLEEIEADLDARSVTVLGVGGVENLPGYAELARTLGIPWCAVMDEDKSATGIVNPKTQKTRALMEALKGSADTIVCWPGCLELSLGITEGSKATPEWQEQNLFPLSSKEMQKRWPEFTVACDSVKQWIAPPKRPRQVPNGGNP